jgi:ABC-type Na+ transport system ATPase subunit NatA
VKYKEENLKYFLRLNKLREEKIRTPFNLLSQKINLNKYSHYSGISANNISKKEMNKCMKYIHDKLKGKK